MKTPVTEVRLPPGQLHETIYRLDGPLRWAIGENVDLVRRGGVQPGARVLDVGAGTGYLSILLADAVGDKGETYCLDLAPQLLEALTLKARRAAVKGAVIPVVAPAQATGLPDNYFDAVFCAYMLHETGDEALAALCEMRRVLKPNHPVVLADYRRIEDPVRLQEIEGWYRAQDDAAGSDEVHLRFSLSDVERLLGEAGFHHIELATWADFHVHATAIK